MDNIEILRSVEILAERVQLARRSQPPELRLLVGIAGAPGAGKSTLAGSLVECLNKGTGSDSAVVVPMDGFHLDNRLLIERDQLAVKGSPQTFDTGGLISLLERLAQPIRADSIYIPLFDRSADLSRNAALEIEPRHSTIVVEGNYLFLKRPAWRTLRPLLQLCVMLDVPIETLERRLVQRWLDNGHTEEAAKRRALSNDIPNAHVVLQESVIPHLRYMSVS